MPQKHLNIGTPNGQNGDFVRDAMSYSEDNFTELYNNTVGEIDVSADWTGGLSFDVVANAYPIESVWYSATPKNLTLNIGDPNFDRIDLFVGNIDGTISKITGEISGAVPAEPNYDYQTQYPIKFILVKAGANTPGGFEDKIVFNENLGDPNEWDFTPDTGIVVSSNNSQNGVYSIEASYPEATKLAKLQTPTSVIVKDINVLSFWVQLKEAFDSNGKIYIYFNDLVGNPNQRVPQSVVTVSHLQYGFNAKSTAWQKITIDMSKVTIYLAEINSINIRPYRSSLKTSVPIGNSTGWFIDKVILQLNTFVGPPTKDYPSRTSAFENDGPDGKSTYMVDKTYDPNNVGADAFSMGNMTESAAKKILTDTERLAIASNTSKVGYPAADANKVGYISVTAAVDLDEIKLKTAENTQKISYPAADATKMGHISVTQPIDLDTIQVFNETVKTLTVTVTPAEMLTLFSSPKLLIPAPGVGKSLRVLSITGDFTYGGVAYDFTTELELRTSISSLIKTVSDVAVVNGGVDNAFEMDKRVGASGQLAPKNEGLELFAPTGNPTVGNGTLKIALVYVIANFN